MIRDVSTTCRDCAKRGEQWVDQRHVMRDAFRRHYYDITCYGIIELLSMIEI